MTKPRIVPVLVTDPDVTHVALIRGGEDGQRASILTPGDFIPVPEDDTLQEDVDRLTLYLMMTDPGSTIVHRCRRLRARFHLDDDPDDSDA